MVICPPGPSGTTILLARASKAEQEKFIGNQSGGRVFLFLGTDDFWRDYNNMISKGFELLENLKKQSMELSRSSGICMEIYGICFS